MPAPCNAGRLALFYSPWRNMNTEPGNKKRNRWPGGKPQLLHIIFVLALFSIVGFLLV